MLGAWTARRLHWLPLVGTMAAFGAMSCGDAHSSRPPGAPLDPALDYVRLDEAQATELCMWWRSQFPPGPDWADDPSRWTHCGDPELMIGQAIRPLEECIEERLSFRELDCAIPVGLFYDCAEVVLDSCDPQEPCRFSPGCQREGRVNHLLP